MTVPKASQLLAKSLNPGREVLQGWDELCWPGSCWNKERGWRVRAGNAAVDAPAKGCVGQPAGMLKVSPCQVKDGNGGRLGRLGMGIQAEQRGRTSPEPAPAGMCCRTIGLSLLSDRMFPAQGCCQPFPAGGTSPGGMSPAQPAPDTGLLLLQVSKAAADLMAYCEAHAKEDPLLTPVPASENPFREKKFFCVIL